MPQAAKQNKAGKPRISSPVCAAAAIWLRTCYIPFEQSRKISPNVLEERADRIRNLSYAIDLAKSLEKAGGRMSCDDAQRTLGDRKHARELTAWFGSFPDVIRMGLLPRNVAMAAFADGAKPLEAMFACRQAAYPEKGRPQFSLDEEDSIIRDLRSRPESYEESNLKRLERRRDYKRDWLVRMQCLNRRASCADAEPA